MQCLVCLCDGASLEGAEPLDLSRSKDLQGRLKAVNIFSVSMALLFFWGHVLI